ncbi:CHAT domain-containing protein [Crocosphaera sp. UHCC 0190]|uniref:CHAT domain-containing protein n=1 Tax=Crocosphaera sp. UHCC 0190 TaxID=3110246 RepID=UPI002B1FAF86|nr:CHAT domain-containing protein [Crocosphaera sp. UHCC 0190]MEA5508682.1 CHAT domain-containing protein [Crocosphaera sp. UHCC 0190]
MLVRFLRFLLLLCLGLTLTLYSAYFPPYSPVIASSIQVEEEQAKEWYQRGQITQAIDIWQKNAKNYAQQGEIVSQARILGYLALAYAQLGEWQKAETAINQSLELLQTKKAEIEAIPVLAEALNIQGTLFLGRGDGLSALSSWEEATKTYEKIKDNVGILRTKINQGRALQALGLYPRACRYLLDTLADSPLNCEDLTSNSLTPLLPKTLTPLEQAGWLSLAQTLRQEGNLDGSQTILEYILTQLPSEETKTSILFSLGKILEVDKDIQGAQENYQQAIAQATTRGTQLKAQLAQLNLLIQQKYFLEAANIVEEIEKNLADFPVNQTKIDAQLYLPQLLLSWSKIAVSSNKLPSWQKIEALLKQAQENSQLINYRQGEAYGLGDQGKLYEILALTRTCQNNISPFIDCSITYHFSDLNQLTLKTEQLREKAQKLTEQSLMQSQAIQSDDITYILQWQLGRILAAAGQKEAAINAYLEAVNTLKSVTFDLINNRDFQLSFREKVEPLYRELLSLLLPQNNQELVDQDNLEEARKQIEALQVAELNNFFQDICVVSQPIDVSNIDPSAAILYPLILRDRLVVLTSLPNQPLEVYVTQITQNKLEEIVKKFRYHIVIRSQREFFDYGQTLYQWLVKPLVAHLEQSKIKTLVFVPDGVLRNIPMSALYDGQKYLIENYQVALTPGLTLLSPQPLKNQRLNTLFSGLTETFREEGLIPLFYVKQELKAVQSQVPTTVLLNEDFTVNNLRKTLENSYFPIVHLATHGQFSSQFDKTFLVAWNSFINVLELERLLKENDPRGNNPIELLILSACETASGDSRAALGLAGFAVRAGARSTLATLWSVNDQASAVIMKQFYSQLSTQNSSKAEALRQAQLAILKNPWYKHPFYWSAYILVGNWL